MTIANFLTVVRIILAPCFLALIVLCPPSGEGSVVCLIILWAIYLLIELSDLADGFFARRLGQVSDLGKLLDPFADSVSRLTCFLGLTVIGLMPLWVFIVVLYRDLWVSFIRVLAAKRGEAMGARVSGKVKAWFYALTTVFGLLKFSSERVLIFTGFHDIIFLLWTIACCCVAAVALWSAIDYSTVLFTGKLLRQGAAQTKYCKKK